MNETVNIGKKIELNNEACNVNVVYVCFRTTSFLNLETDT